VFDAGQKKKGGDGAGALPSKGERFVDAQFLMEVMVLY
jgi:hypothetical protein